MHFSGVFVSAVLVQGALAVYGVADNFTGPDFFSKWTFFTGPDPTNGFVNYVDAATASSGGLASINDKGQAYIGVDSTTTLTVGGTGRNSVRLISSNVYTHYLTVLDLAHMPGGVCGTWPAFWSFGSGGTGWPSEGEIDIIEGVNDQTTNFMTLHTAPNCTIGTSSSSSLQPFSTDCNALVNDNEGCTFHDTNTATYGAGFNAAGGGVIAAEWLATGVNIWFWAHGATPADAFSAAPDPSTWGTPLAQWAGSGCDWDGHLLTHNLLFDTTFCGSWGDRAWDSCKASTGAATCGEFVAGQPAAFKDAYWLVNSLVVYTNSGTAAQNTSSVPHAKDMRIGDRRSARHRR